MSTDDVHDRLKKELEEIINIYEEVGYTVFDSMYVAHDPDAILFCKLVDIAKKSNKRLIIHDCAWARLGNNRQTEILDFSVSLKKPCCISHAMELLTQEFIDRCDDLYGEHPDLRQYYLEGIDVRRITEEAIHIDSLCGT